MPNQCRGIIFKDRKGYGSFQINPADYLRELFEALPTMEQKEVTNWISAK